MNRKNKWCTNKLVFVLAISCYFINVQAQNDQVSIEPVGEQEFRVSTANGIPYTIVLEESNNDGQYHLGSSGSLTFKIADMIDTRSTLRIVFEDEIYHSLENKLIKQYQSDLQWIESLLDVKEGEFKKLPSRPVFTDDGLEKLKATVFEYATTEKKEAYFYQWIEKINYSVGAVNFFRELYAASNGEDNEQRHNFLPINIYAELQKNKR